MTEENDCCSRCGKIYLFIIHLYRASVRAKIRISIVRTRIEALYVRLNTVHLRSRATDDSPPYMIRINIL